MIVISILNKLHHIKMTKLKKIKRLVKSIYILPSTKEKLEQLGQISGFTQGQIVDLALDQLSEKLIIDKAISVKSMDAA